MKAYNLSYPLLVSLIASGALQAQTGDLKPVDFPDFTKEKWKNNPKITLA